MVSCDVSQLAFAYGSGAFRQVGLRPTDFRQEHRKLSGCDATLQEGYEDSEALAPEKRPMLDLVFVVEDPLQWHRANMQVNGHHYAAHLRILGPGAVVTLQQDFAARIFYNTLVPMSSPAERGRSMKYGVVTWHDLREDLLSWRWLYLAGRLHKPVHIITGSDNGEVTQALHENLLSASRSALLSLPASFSSTDFFLVSAKSRSFRSYRTHCASLPNKKTYV